MTWANKPLHRPWQEYQTRYLKNIAWIEQNCFVPDGKDAGIPVVLRSWQRWILRSTYSTVSPTRRLIFSVGRKNAKTALSAMIVILHTAGPEARQNTELYSSALSRDQASLVFNLAAKMIRLSPTLNEFITIRDTNKQLFCQGLGTLYRALSADAPTTYGLSPVLVVHDELGQVRGPRHALYEALETATSAHENPLSIIISTQAPSDADLLSVLIDDAKQKHDPRTKLFLWTAPEGEDAFCEKTIRMANPAFGDFQNAKEVLAMAQDAKRMPSREAEYRNLILNQRVEAYNPFVTKSVWIQSGEMGHLTGEVYGGLDLSETNDLTALVLVDPSGDTFDVKATFWLPEEGLTERARKDRVPYDLWAKEGHLTTTPGKSIEYEYVAQYIADLFNTINIARIAFDRYNMRHLKPWLIRAGLSESLIDERFVEFGQGYVSMGPALRVLESLLLNAKLRHGNHPILNMCAANSVVKYNEAGDRKLDKAKSRGRIDGMVSLAMACSVANEERGRALVFPVEEEDILE